MWTSSLFWPHQSTEHWPTPYTLVGFFLCWRSNLKPSPPLDHFIKLPEIKHHFNRDWLTKIRLKIKPQRSLQTQTVCLEWTRKSWNLPDGYVHHGTHDTTVIWRVDMQMTPYCSCWEWVTEVSEHMNTNTGIQHSQYRNIFLNNKCFFQLSWAICIFLYIYGYIFIYIF